MSHIIEFFSWGIISGGLLVQASAQSRAMLDESCLGAEPSESLSTSLKMEVVQHLWATILCSSALTVNRNFPNIQLQFMFQLDSILSLSLSFLFLFFYCALVRGAWLPHLCTHLPRSNSLYHWRWKKSEILLSPHVSWIAVLSAGLTPAMSTSLSHQGTQKWAQSSSCGLTSAELYCLEYYGVSI